MPALRVAFAGTPEFSVPALAALLRSRHSVVGVLTQPDRPAGRGRQLTASPVKQLALASGLPLDQPQTLKSVDGRAALARWQSDLLVVVAYGLILPPAALELPRLGCVNIHASLLPRWRGAAPIQRAILAGDSETGVTIMQMDAGLDTGPMLCVRRVAIAPDATSADLQTSLAAEGAAALLEAVDALADGRARPVPQPAEGVSYAHKIAKSEAPIDWSRSAIDIDRQIRAFNPWPMATTVLDGETLRVHGAHPAPATDAASRAQPGTILDLHDEALHVACGAGVLGLTMLQRPGRRAMSAREFSQGLAVAGRVLQ